MEPNEYRRAIKSVANPETGQHEFLDPEHPLARKDGHVMLSRHLMSLRVGRWLRPGEVVTYRDGDPENLSDENLELTSIGKLSHLSRNNPTILYCPYCGLSFKVTPSHKNRRVYHSDACRRLADRKFEVDPEELRQLVWEIPTTQVAAIFGVSDKAIEKRCRAYGISKPPRGYWMQLDHRTGSREEKR
jgi:hypothetical protein